MSLDLPALLARHGHDPTRLVQILREIDLAEGWLAPATITAVAAGLGLPRGQVEGVATFYAFFDSRPMGRYRVRFSDGVTDRMAGSVALRERLQAALGVGPGEVSAGGRASVRTTSCTGLCDQGPALLVNDRAIGKLTPERIDRIAALILADTPLSAWPAALFAVDTIVHRRDLLLSTPLVPGEALAAAEARGRDGVIEALRRSGLRGRGGAGFATATKWAACRDAAAEERVIVCNADEGEPGTFKDRVLLTAHLDEVIEGMTVAAFVVGARRGFLYLRGEYPFLIPGIEAALARRRAAGLLGPARGFDIALHVGAGAYICGEESALLESLEGKRGIPRSRPPYPVTHGWRGLPTVVNNVETLLAAAYVARHGGEWLRQRGTATSAGTKVLSVAGDVARPGVYEVPFGTSVADVLAMAGAGQAVAGQAVAGQGGAGQAVAGQAVAGQGVAGDIAAVQVGGPSGTLLAPTELGRKLAFEDVPGAGAITVFGRGRDVLDVVDQHTRFFAHESCGFCTPCRVGTTLAAQMTARIAAGRGTRRDVKDLARIAKLMKAASHCGLGATAGNPALDALARFRPAIDARLVSREVMPVFDLDAALAPARELTGRDDPGAHLAPTEGEPDRTARSSAAFERATLFASGDGGGRGGAARRPGADDNGASDAEKRRDEPGARARIGERS